MKGAKADMVKQGQLGYRRLMSEILLRAKTFLFINRRDVGAASA